MLAVLLTGSAALTACGAQIDRHGHVFIDVDLSQIQPGMSKEQVQTVLGSPDTTSTIGGDAYYYISTTQKTIDLQAIITPEDIADVRNVVDEIYIDDKIKNYIVDIVCATRDPGKYKLDIENFISYGASPRATIYLAIAAKAHAFIQQRGYVTPQDIKSIGMDVLRHRVIVSYEAEAESVTSAAIVQRILDYADVP